MMYFYKAQWVYDHEKVLKCCGFVRGETYADAMKVAADYLGEQELVSIELMAIETNGNIVNIDADDPIYTPLVEFYSNQIS